MSRFSKARLGLLVSTDVAARGLDFKQIDKVVHLQRPRDTETFVHRSGRTARAGCTGRPPWVGFPQKAVNSTSVRVKYV